MSSITDTSSYFFPDIKWFMQPCLIYRPHCCFCCGCDQTETTVGLVDKTKFVIEQICEQTPYNLHHMNRAKHITEYSAMAKLWDILRGWVTSCPPKPYLSTWIGLKSRGPVPRQLDGEINLTQTSSCLTCDYGKAGVPGYIECRNSVCCW